MSKKKSHPFEQGSIRDQWRYLWAPLVKFKPARFSQKEWMELLWDTKARDIQRFKARERFALPGLFCSAPLVLVQGIGDRRIFTTSTLFVTSDERMPNHILVEVTGPFRKEESYVLTSTEWLSIRAKLEEVPWKEQRTRRKPVLE